MTTNKHDKRAAFTIAETLITIGILAILIAILLPAVWQVREAAKRTQCMNNIRQLALGILNAESAHGRLPPATGMGYGHSAPPTTNRYSGFVFMTPFLGRYGGPYAYNETTEVNGVSYPAFPDVDSEHPFIMDGAPLGLRCPSVDTDDSKVGEIHYAFSIGDAGRNLHQPQAIRGAFAIGRNQRLDEVTDGSSNTIALAEIGGIGPRSVGRRFAIKQPEKYLNNPSSTKELVDASRNYQSGVELSERIRGGNWFDGIGGPGLVNTILPPGSPNLLVDGELLVDGFFSASINHRGGTVVAMLDGSTHFLSSEIDCGDQTHATQSAEELFGLPTPYGVWGSLGSANGGESIDEEAWNP